MGPCFPRDNRAFASYASKVGVNHNIGHVTDAFNEDHATFLKEYFINKNKKKLPFLFNYLTYKPNTDILTESQQYRLCLDLLNEGYMFIVLTLHLKINVTQELYTKNQLRRSLKLNYDWI